MNEIEAEKVEDLLFHIHTDIAVLKQRYLILQVDKIECYIIQANKVVYIGDFNFAQRFISWNDGLSVNEVNNYLYRLKQN